MALRFPPPPEGGSDQLFAELAELKEIQARRTPEMEEKARFLESGPTTRRWTEIHLGLIVKHRPNPPRAARGLALLHVAMSDAAAWDSKYAYGRRSPPKADPSLVPLFAPRANPSYPSEHAVVAGAAAALLGYLFPDEPAGRLDALVQEEADSRLWAGVNFRSDLEEGLQLGRAVSEQVITRAKSDGSDQVWDGSGRPEAFSSPRFRIV